MAEEEVYYRYVEDHRQRQGHLGASRAVMTLRQVRRDGRGSGEEERREPEAAARRPKRPRYPKQLNYKGRAAGERAAQPLG